jgi:hypothetical protein
MDGRSFFFWSSIKALSARSILSVLVSFGAAS